MKRKLFNETLDFEINVIGYKSKGESIVFFLKADDKVIYAGLVDCYEEAAENVALKLLDDEKVKRFDFICWTHPHDDHTIGMDKILKDYCDEKTLFWMSPYLLKDVEEYSEKAQDVYQQVFEIFKSTKRNKITIREASDTKILEQFECRGNVSISSYNFEIKSFAPDTNLLRNLEVNERFEKGNIYSIGLVINIGHYYIVLAGDVENRTIKFVPDFNFGVGDRVDYIKIPHHASSSASNLIDRFNKLNIAAPAVATTTVYRIHKLPDKEILKRYAMWDKNVEIYSTGDIDDARNDKEKSGIVKTTFDILEKKEIPITTILCGNAIRVNSIVS